MKRYKKTNTGELFVGTYVTAFNMEEVAGKCGGKVREVYSSRAKFLVLPGSGGIAWPTDTILEGSLGFIAVNSATLVQHYEEA